MSITGTPGEPMKVGVALVDALTAKDAVIGILAALRAREPDGTGQRVEVTCCPASSGRWPTWPRPCWRLQTYPQAGATGTLRSLRTKLWPPRTGISPSVVEMTNSSGN